MRRGNHPGMQETGDRRLRELNFQSEGLFKCSAGIYSGIVFFHTPAGQEMTAGFFLCIILACRNL
jgi:hypothetical protein